MIFLINKEKRTSHKAFEMVNISFIILNENNQDFFIFYFIINLDLKHQE